MKKEIKKIIKSYFPTELIEYFNSDTHTELNYFSYI